jgi:hypothetical protein
MTETNFKEIDETHHRRLKPPGLLLVTLTAIWLGVVGIGLSWMWEYETTPGEITKSPTHWPVESQIERSASCPTLIVFAHPRCPCTRASIRELELIMAHCNGRVDARVLFFKPTDSSAEWEKTDLWLSAEAIPGVKVHCDEDCSEAEKFCATTSGYSLLYNPNGQLLFSGGITGSRGHSGDNAGRSSIESLVMNGVTNQKRTFVFGCSLLGQDDDYTKEN